MSEFTYDANHLVVVYRACSSCVSPTTRGGQRHLREFPHNLRGAVHKATTELLDGYGRRRSLDELKEEVRRLNLQRSDSGQLAQPVQGLMRHDGFYCLRPQCIYCTRNLANMKEHLRVEHRLKAAQQKTMHGQLWKECKLQTYFKGGNRINYFAVEPLSNTQDITQLPQATTTQQDQERQLKEDMLFEKISKDVKEVTKDQEEAAKRTGFPSHLTGLKVEEIYSSYQLPKVQPLRKAGDDGRSDGRKYDPESYLMHIVRAAERAQDDAAEGLDDDATTNNNEDASASNAASESERPPSSEPTAEDLARLAALEAENICTTMVSGGMTLTAKYTTDEYRVAFADVFRSLCHLETMEVKRNLLQPYVVTPQIVGEVIKFFFHRVFNIPGARQVQNLVKQLQATDEWKIVMNATTSPALHLPMSLGDFKVIMDMEKRIISYGEYSNCKELVDKNKDIMTFLNSKGHFTKQGVGKVTLLKDYLSDKLGINREQLDKHFQLGRVLHMLTSTFGAGILPLLPRETYKL
ncbi:hypothetical protein VC83_04249 [Pseudogymnoascus destructans]|nr:uncharacterized protein VC83_04249 [Pseudogymnoascus destructans]OAF59188.1 hypothetical protein VC83_04249 [Pseudogymnoascus destructans]